MGRKVELMWGEVANAAHNGMMRHIKGLAEKRRPSHGLQEIESTWTQSIEGALAEMVWAKQSDCYPSLGLLIDSRCGDTRRGIEVRGTPLDHGRLLLHKTDYDDRRYVLVTGIPPTFMIRGWLYGREGKQPRYWNEQLPRPCFAVPQADLHEIETLDGAPAAAPAVVDADEEWLRLFNKGR